MPKIPNLRLKYERNLDKLFSNWIFCKIKPRKRQDVEHFKATDFCVPNLSARQDVASVN